jgi:hypothetical protein
MFADCTSLTTAPELPATTLVTNCYYRMFEDCSSLNAIVVGLTDWQSGTTDRWVYGVAAKGTFTKPSALHEAYSYNRIPEGWEVVNISPPPPEPSTPLTFTAEEANSTVKLEATGIDLATARSVKYRTNDKGYWKAYRTNQVITLVNIGDYVQFKNETEQWSETGNEYIKFVMTGKVAGSGNVNSLIYYAETLPYCCYHSMFNGCSSLTTAPELPATTLAVSCYASMFWYCSSLAKAPELPATTLASHCYYQMFYGCTSLTSAPALPATTLAPYCYSSMFRSCSSLTTAPELSATTLANYCYYQMFYGCTSLTSAPVLPATRLVWCCYSNMFYNCSSLSSIAVKFTKWLDDSTDNWVEGVSSTGTFTHDGLPEEYGVSRIPEAWEAIDTSLPQPEPSTPLTFTAEEANSTVKLEATGIDLATARSVKYRTSDKEHWKDYRTNQVITLSKVGDYVQFKNETEQWSEPGNEYIKFVMKGKIAASGNVNSLINYSDTLPEYCYYHMFYGCTSLTTAPALPATTLASMCYYHMFNGCTGLTTAPELPATTLAEYCCYGMFQGCTSLTASPDLPVTTLAHGCYRGMFRGCSSLTTAPELPATTLAEYCYIDMFYGCSRLTTAPSLPATALAGWCYNGMFEGCTSLTTAPELPATTLAEYCYSYMFYGCTSLTTAPTLLATTLVGSCYSYMFSGCSALNSITVKFTEWLAGATDNWVKGVAATGTFTKPSALTKKTGVNYIPSGWTVVNK